jgi:hypothetical protein
VGSFAITGGLPNRRPTGGDEPEPDHDTATSSA